MDCDPRPEYGLEDYKGAYWEIIPENIEYNPAIRAGAKTMSDLFLDNPNAQFTFIWEIQQGCLSKASQATLLKWQWVGTHTSKMKKTTKIFAVSKMITTTTKTKDF